MMKNDRWLLIFTVLIISTLLVAGCASMANPTPAPSQGGLSGEWTLTEINGAAPLNGSTTTLKLENGEVSGKAGCNSYGGTYLLQGRKLSFENIFSTEMACEAPAGIMEQEINFLQTLNQTASFEIDGGKLILRNMSGGTSLIFEQ